jgi:MerT mercuric transport protein
MNESSANSCCEPARTPAVPDEAATGRTQKLVAAGGILGALAASSCCIAPLALFSLGISGAWIGNLTALAPYQPYFIAATLVCLGYGYWLVYRPRKAACAAGAACAKDGRKNPHRGDGRGGLSLLPLYGRDAVAVKDRAFLTPALILGASRPRLPRTGLRLPLYSE